jgi:ABC-2 type transport system ATP-binding protein
MKSKGTTIFISSHILAEVQEVCDRVGIINKGVIVAEDTVAKLRNKLNLKPKLIIELEKITKKIIDSVNKINGVQLVENIGNIIHITCDSKTKSKIILSIEKSGGNILNIHTKDPSLEDIFMKYTEENIEWS